MKGLIDPAADVGSCVEASLSRAKDGNAHGKSNQQVPNRMEKLRQSLKRLLLRRKLADKNTFDGEPYTQESINILRAAETQGYVLSVANNKTIAATKNNVTLFVRSNGDIQRFGQNRGFI
jgi:hypothetical protein